MKYKRLLGVLFVAFAVSCLLSLMMRTLQATYRPEQPNLGWLGGLLALATMPGEFVAMMAKGMCNTNSAAGMAIKILVNTMFYFVPVLLVAALVEMKIRQRRATKALDSEANLADARRS